MGYTVNLHSPHFLMVYFNLLINPCFACTARVTVVVSCVCLPVCLSAHAILLVHAIKSITNDIIVLSVRFAAILKWRFSLNCLIRKLDRVYLPREGLPSFVDAYTACNVSYTLRYMFA